MSGKWHVCSDQSKPNGSWPLERGFEKYYGIITGAADYFQPKTLYRDNTNVETEAKADPSYYITDAIADNACRFIREHTSGKPDAPFFLYTASPLRIGRSTPNRTTSPKYKGKFDSRLGPPARSAAQTDARHGYPSMNNGRSAIAAIRLQPPWEDAKNKEWELRRMEVYAAQIDLNIGRILDTLRQTGQFENTLVIFLADNGGCAEELSGDWRLERTNIAQEITRDGQKVKFGNNPAVMPGTPDTYQSYGVPWANLSNTPFRYYKHWVHEGGIATPLIMHWPAGIQNGGIRHQPAQLTDVMPTILELTGASYPKANNGHEVPPPEGTSLVPLFADKPNGKKMLFWEHEGNAAVREGKWKLVKNFTGARSATPGFDPSDRRGPWELYDLEQDRTELHDLSAQHPDRVAAMSASYQAWAKRCAVIDREVILRQHRK